MASGRKRKVKVTVSQPEVRVLPTPERLNKTDGNFIQSATNRFIMTDAPLDRLRNQNKITQPQWEAGNKFRFLFYQAGLEGRFGSQDLNQIAGGGTTSYGMPVSEQQAYYRQQYRDSLRALGLDLSSILSDFVCRETPIIEIGNKREWKDKNQARAVGLELIKVGLSLLAQHFGIIKKM